MRIARWLSVGLAAAACVGRASEARAQFVLTAVKAKTPPVIDGRLDPTEWEGATRAGDFVQFEPQRGQRSPLVTEARVLYDDLHIYIAFHAADDGDPTAQLTSRDADLLSDDAVIVVLDSYHDRRTGYYFAINPLGTQSDGRIADDGRTLDSSWDAPWRSAAARTATGWSAELAIPLSSIKYVAGDNRTWGLNLGRSHRRRFEVSFWAGPLDSQYRVSQAGELSGLSVPPPPDRLQLVPYALARAEEGRRVDGDAGVDVRYVVTPQTAAYLTINPDFATVEADQEQINLTRFEVSLREKRQFFLEGQELFQQRIRTFYSRRIADIAAGAKLLGKEGPWTIAALSTESERLAGGGRANYAVARAQRDVGRRSNVALMLSNRALAGQDQGALELDSNLFFTKTFGFTGQFVKTHGPFKTGTIAWFVRPSHDSPTGHAHFRYTHLGDRVGDNLNSIGQIRDDDRREADSAVNRTWWPKAGRFERLQYDSNYNIYWGQTGVLRSWQIDEGFTLDLRNRWSLGAAYTEEFKRFEADFRNRQISGDIGYNTRQYQSVRAGFRFGRNFGSDFRLWTASGRWKPTEAFSAEYELQRLYLDPDPEDETTWIHVLRANHFFTKDLFVRVFFQTNSAIDRRNLQSVFVWRYKPPFGQVQIAFQRGTAAFGERSGQGNTLFVKTSAVF